MNLSIVEVDYTDPDQTRDLLMLLKLYAQDPMGGGKPLDKRVEEQLVTQLNAIDGAFSLLCYNDNEPVGLINALPSFSTFQCRPIVNIHDVVVISSCRGAGVAQRLLNKVEEIARKRDCCKVTLEVLENNESAKKAYQKAGFSGYELDPKAGKALFWEKALS